MRFLLFVTLVALTSVLSYAQPAFDETHVEGYIIDKKGERTDGVLLLNADYETYAYLNQNKVGFITRKKWDKLNPDKKVKNKEFDTFKGKDLSEYGFGEVRYIVTRWVSVDGTADPLAAAKKMFYEVLYDGGQVKILRVWPSGQKALGNGGQIMSDGAILVEGMKAPRIWNQMNFGKWLADCDEMIYRIENGDYAPISMKTGKIGLGGLVSQVKMNWEDEDGMPKGLLQTMRIAQDYKEACDEK